MPPPPKVGANGDRGADADNLVASGTNTTAAVALAQDIISTVSTAIASGRRVANNHPGFVVALASVFVAAFVLAIIVRACVRCRRRQVPEEEEEFQCVSDKNGQKGYTRCGVGAVSVREREADENEEQYIL